MQACMHTCMHTRTYTHTHSRMHTLTLYVYIKGSEQVSATHPPTPCPLQITLEKKTKEKKCDRFGASALQ